MWYNVFSYSAWSGGMLLKEELLNKIKQNKVGISLDLQNLDLEDEDVDALIAALKENNTINSINLSENEYISDSASKRLVELLRENVVISSIDLSGTGAGRQTAQCLSAILEENITLVEFDGLPTINELQGLREGQYKTELIDWVNTVDIKLTQNKVRKVFGSFTATGELSDQAIADALCLLEKRYPAIKVNLDRNDDGGHYIPEAYRVLTGLYCMSLGSNEKNASIKALNYLAYPYESELKELANLALMNYLFTAENLNQADSSVQEARYQLLLHAGLEEAGKPNSPWMFMLSYALMRAKHQGKEVPNREFGHGELVVTRNEITDYLASVDMKKANQCLEHYLVPSTAKSTQSSLGPRLFSASVVTPSSAPSLNPLTNKK